MNLKKRFITLLLLLTVLLTSCVPKSIPTNANAAFSNFTQNLFRQDVSATTIGLHYTLQNPENYGITNTPITYGSFETDEKAALAALENCQAALNKFPYHSLSKENQLTHDVLSSYIATAVRAVPYSLYEEPLSPVTGIHAQLPVLLAEYQFFSAKDVETYLNLIATTPDYFSSLIQFEQRKSNAGLFMPDSVVDSVLEQCDSFLAMGEENYLLSTFEERISTLDTLSEEAKSAFSARNRELLASAILPAYRQLSAALKDLKGSGKNTGGLCNFPHGKDYYACLISRDTGSSRSVKELDKLIQKQISSDLADMKTILSAHPELAKQTTAPLDIPPSTIIQELKQKISNAFPEPAAVTTYVKYVPKPLEPYLSPAFYMIPSIDNTSENVIYINQAHGMENMTLFTTLAHEGYPGHLYQTTYYADTHPNPIRSLLNFSGYVEGWATYAEMCSYYFSPLDKPAASILQKNSSVILGLYAAADIGIHYKNWDLEKTADFFSSYGITDKHTVQQIYQIIISDPANYLKYYVGYIELLELKKDVLKKEKGNFSQKKFHKAVLDIGPAPFDVVEKWIGDGVFSEDSAPSSKHSVRQPYTRHNPSQCRRQSSRQCIPCLSHVRRHKIHTHRIKNRFRTAHHNRSNQPDSRICPKLFEHIKHQSCCGGR